MRARFSLLLIVLLFSTGSARTPVFEIVDRIAGPDGFYDYVTVDPGQRRVFVGRSNGVTRIDIDTRVVRGSWISSDAVAAVVAVPETMLAVATNPERDGVTIFDRLSGKIHSHVDTGKEPDGAMFDPFSKHVFVMNGESADTSVIEPVSGKNVGTIGLGGKPEAGVSDGEGRLFINIEDKAEIAVIDAERMAVVAHYPLRGCDEPTGIAYDAVSKTLVSVCHNGVAKLIDARSGAERGSFPIAGAADGVVFDASRRLLFVPCDAGTLVIASLGADGRARIVQRLKTQEGARTAALDPQSGRVYLPVSRYAKAADGSRRENADGWWERVPGTFAVLVVDKR